MNGSTGYAIWRDDDRNLALAVQQTADERWRVTNWQETPAHRGFAGDLARDLGRRGSQTAAILGGPEVTCTVTQLPLLRRRELTRAVTGWVARKEGGTPADWQVAWQPLAPRDRAVAEQQDVFLAYASQQAITEAVARGAAVGVRPGVMLPPQLVLDQFFRLAGPGREDLRVWNLVFVGDRFSFLCVANRASLLLSRPLPRDLSAGADPEEYLDRLVTEVERSVFFARQSEGSPQVDRVMVCGQPAIASALVARLQEAEEPAEAWDLATVLDPGAFPVTVDDYLLVAAAALAGQGVALNLAPAASRQLLGPVARRRTVLATTAAAAAVVPLLMIGGLVTARVQDSYLEAATARLEEATVQAETAAQVYARERLLRAREDYLAAYLSDRRDLDGVLRHIAGLTPPQVRYRDLQLVKRASHVHLYLVGESTAASVTEAQRAFMTFHAALGEAPQLRAIGEPRELEILDRDDAGNQRKTVRFALDYELVATPAGEEG